MTLNNFTPFPLTVQEIQEKIDFSPVVDKIRNSYALSLQTVLWSSYEWITPDGVYEIKRIIEKGRWTVFSLYPWNPKTQKYGRRKQLYIAGENVEHIIYRLSQPTYYQLLIGQPWESVAKVLNIPITKGELPTKGRYKVNGWFHRWSYHKEQTIHQFYFDRGACRVYHYRDQVINGRIVRDYKSITLNTMDEVDRVQLTCMTNMEAFFLSLIL